VSKRSGRSRPKPQRTSGYTAPPPHQQLGKGSMRTAPRTPSAIETSMSRAGMDSTAAMGPGRPLNPYQGYSQPPRAMDYPVGVNISTRTRASWGLPSFETIRAIVKAYDVARMCVNHKIDELRSMELMFLPAEGERGDVADAIAAARAVMEFPDRELPYDVWLSKWLENAFKFDAAPLYKRRNRDGDVIGLESLDGTTIMPYIDEHGRRPTAPDPAYYQLIHGQPWNWYSHQDITYCMFRPQEDAPFGTAPMESLLLTANTDIRFQWHFLQMFTEGSIPGGFVEVPPDISSPDQVAEWQDYWDATVMGDQAKLHQLLAVPAGTRVTGTKPEAFDSAFPEYLMMRTCAGHGVIPQDLGLIKDVNRANGETQTDIQFRVNTLPWVNWVQGHLTRYLQRDIGLPVQVKLNTGRDKEDRLADAQAWKIYIESGMASADEGRSEVLGLPVDNERPTPRFFNNTRLGPIPLLAIEGVSGKTDPETHGPAPDQPALDMPYVGPVGVVPQAGTADAAESLSATDAYQVSERNQMLAEQGHAPMPAPVTKAAATAELAAFRKYADNRLARGRWRDFEFRELNDPIAAHRLNDGGRAAVRKAVGSPVAAGLAVRARDTGRVLMLQRGLDEEDPASGTWEFPGGHIEDGESPLAAAVREWSEEVGILLAVGDPAGQWASRDDVYRGFVVDVPDESCVPIFSGRDSVTNPDDPDGDAVQAIAWWDPEQLPGNPAVRDELGCSIEQLLDALDVTYAREGDTGTCPCGTPVVFDPDNGWAHGDGSFGHDDGETVAEKMGLPVIALRKAGRAGPKGQAPDQGPESVKDWPGWSRDLQLARIYADRIREALTGCVDTAALAGRWLAANPIRKAADGGDGGPIAAAQAWLDQNGVRGAIAHAFQDALTGAYAEAYALGGRSAQAMVDGVAPDWGAWMPGDPQAADLILGADGLGDGLRRMLSAQDIQIKSLGSGRFDDLAQAIALSLENGDSVDTLARDLRDILDDASRARMVATTEIARAVAAASFDTYRANGIAYADWLDAEDGRVCAICEDNAANGPYLLAQFPEIPGHPRCRCAPGPVVDASAGSAPPDTNEGE
jgi:SPP1 gp7 family putative phage head morphogenesis protein